MGGTNSCLPLPVYTITTIRRRRYEPKKFYQRNTGSENQRIPFNLNKVSEEELQRIPGVTRPIAKEIIAYRQTNQGFKRVDELLKIDGVNFKLLQHLRLNLFVDSSSQPVVTRKRTVNLNTATIDQLVTVPGLTRVLAERIVQKRDRKGSFRFIEDLLKIKGIDYIVLAQLRSYVTVEERILRTSVSESSLVQLPTNTIYPTLNRNSSHVASDSLSLASLILETLPPELQTIFLSSPTPIVTQIPIECNKNFRFASWNLQQLTTEKAQNLGVKEVICRVILEHNLSLIGVQEVGSKDALGYIVQELNNPTIPSIKDRKKESHRRWTYVISEVAGRMFQGSEYLGFIYEETGGIQCQKSSLLPFKTYFTRSPFIGIFRIYDKHEIVFVNIHLKARRLDEDENERTKDEAISLSILAQAMDDTVEQKDVIIFGDFNLPPTAAAFDPLLEKQYSCSVRENTNISLKTPQGSTCTDNFWLSESVKKYSAEKATVIRENLTNMWIPAGWAWGGLVSDHCPIFIELDLSG